MTVPIKSSVVLNTDERQAIDTVLRLSVQIVRALAAHNAMPQMTFLRIAISLQVFVLARFRAQKCCTLLLEPL